MKKITIVILATCVVSFLSLVSYAGIMDFAPGGRIDDIRTSFNSEKSRIVIESPSRISYKHFTLSSPDRLVIDIDNVESFDGVPLLDKRSPLLKSIRTSKRGDNSYRVVVDSSAPFGIEDRFQLLPSGGEGFRLVIDLSPKSVPQATLIGKTTPEKAGEKSEKRDLVIVVDPGHGGKDPGAIGPSGTYEKDVVLAISKHLAKLIDNTPGMLAKMTRDDDRYLHLKERTQFARRHQADFFLSIHADAFTNPRPKGPSVYALSEKGATSESARWIADRANAESLSGGGEKLDLSMHDDVLANVLMDLSMTGTLSHSLRAGDKIISSMATLATPHKPKVEQANFVVLRSPDIPSLLVEAGFLTNPQEEKRLRDPGYQKKVAKHIYQGLIAYYRDNSPPYAKLQL